MQQKGSKMENEEKALKGNNKIVEKMTQIWGR